MGLYVCDPVFTYNKIILVLQIILQTFNFKLLIKLLLQYAYIICYIR